MNRISKLAALVLASAAALTATAQTEGYDPLRQITQIVVPARLLIVQDTTGSMEWNKDATNQNLTDGGDSTGRLVWKSGHSGTRSGSNYSTWTYSLRYDDPSRLAIVKNALGNTVSLVTTFTPPTDWETYWLNILGRSLSPDWNLSSISCTPPSGYTCVLNPPSLQWPPAPSGASPGPWTWTVSLTQTNTKRFNPGAGTKTVTDTPFPDPGVPIHAYCGDGYPGSPACTSADLPSQPAVCGASPSLWACSPQDGFPLTPPVAAAGNGYTFELPHDVIGANVNEVRWGLLAFSTDRGDCDTNQFLVPIDTASATQDVTTLEKYFWLSSNKITTSPASLGLTASGGTDTIGALTHAKDVMKKTYNGGSVSLSNGGSTINLAADPKRSCNPPYGVILATDGLSNQCNPNNGDWISGCGACPGPTCCDVGSSGYDCPSTPSKFAAQVAHDIWNLTMCPAGYTYCSSASTCLPNAQSCPTCTGGKVYCPSTGKCQLTTEACPVSGTQLAAIHPRTWTIGVSTQVGPCELDFIAYAGRTDASSPNGDAGYDYTKDRYNTGNAQNPSWTYLLPQSDFAANATPGALANPTTTTGNFGANYDGPTGQYKWYRNTNKAYSYANKTSPYDQHQEYAFFATSPGAIADAITAIVNGTASGDYATSAPTSGGGIGQGNRVILPSADFPGWKGHLYWFDITKDPTDPLYRIMDAGALMPTPAKRSIYTWDPSNGNALVEVVTGNRPTLQAIAGGFGLANPATTFTDNVVDFIRGNDGNLSNTARTWYLGPFINTTPAIIGGPAVFTQHQVPDHSSFETTYAVRRPLVWVGSDDGMLHAFDFTLGREEIAILPPDLLPKQVQLYAQYKLNPEGRRVTGQPDRIGNHIYGVANSLRFGDVYMKSDNQYHTVAFLTEGGGGQGIAAIDVTHPFAGNDTVTPKLQKDPNYSSSEPVKVLWSTTGGGGAGQLSGLFQSWSVPSMAATKSDKWTMVLGGGLNPASTATSQVTPRVFTLDLTNNPTSPSFQTKTIGNGGPTALVGNQSFADTVTVSTAASGFRSDNIADLGLQADLNGRIWYLTGDDLAVSITVGIDANAVAGGRAQPLYYSPAVSGYGPKSTSCDSFAFGSGTFYERSAKVTGPGVGTGTNFIPSLYLAINKKPVNGNPADPVPNANVLRVPIAGTWQISADGGVTYANVMLGPRTQLTAPPFIISPFNGVGPVQAIFAVYDPDNGCNGHSYILSITATLPTSCDAQVTTVVPNNASDWKVGFDAGKRAVAGLTSTGPGQFVAAVSGLGQDTQANILKVAVQQNAQGNGATVRPVWWKEHK